MNKGVGRKISRGTGGQRKKIPKTSKKDQKNSSIEPLPGGGATEKRPKNSKKDR